MKGQQPKQNPTPTVSVVMPAYKTAAFIAKALDSVMVQTFRDFEVIVINDGSPDTPELEKVLEPYMKDIVYINQPNGGPARARNAGIRRARAPFIALLDSDDYWESEYLSVQLRVLQEDPTIAAVYPNGLFFGNPEEEGKTYMDLFPSNGEVTFVSVVRGQCNPMMGGMTFRKEAVVRAGMYDPEFIRAEDLDLWLRFLKLGERIVYHRQVLYHVRGGRPDSLTRNLKEMRTSFLRVLEKNERMFSLSPEERIAVQKSKERITAEQQYDRGKKAFMAGDVPAAIREITSANAYFRSWKLVFMLALMKTAPSVLRKLATMRTRP